MPSDTDMPVIPDERADDLHDMTSGNACDLIIFMAGNQFMVMGELLDAFARARPHIGRIAYETLPPGLELKQILAGGAVFRGRRITVRPDIYTSVSSTAMQRLAAAGRIGTGSWSCYLHNRLVLMVPAGNPAGISSVTDLGADDVRISQPDPAGEDIAAHIINMYRDAGGPALVDRIMTAKRAGGSTRMTVVHHRQTPQRIAAKTVDVGPVWASEAAYAKRCGLACEIVEPGAALDQHDRIEYYVADLIQAPHPHHAAAFKAFLLSPAAQQIFERHGFIPKKNCGTNQQG